MQTLALVAVGANTPIDGQPLEDTMSGALEKIDTPGCRVVGKSRLFHTPCFPTDAGPDYLNAAAVVQTSLSAADLLSRLHDVENLMGRQRVQRWGNRTLDLDLLAWGDAVLPDRATYDRWRDLSPEKQRDMAPNQLILPHPRMQDRAFVLIPLMDVAPDWRHPVSGQTVRQMAASLDPADKSAVVPVSG